MHGVESVLPCAGLKKVIRISTVSKAKHLTTPVTTPLETASKACEFVVFYLCCEAVALLLIVFFSRDGLFLAESPLEGRVGSPKKLLRKIIIFFRMFF